MASNAETMTERQRAAWPEAVAEVGRYTEYSVSDDPDHYYWTVRFAEETRPGRGCAMTALYCDGEHFAQISMDVYGYPAVSVAEVLWLHNSSDEDCDCRFCTKEREDDD